MARRRNKKPPIGTIIAVVLVVSCAGIGLGGWWIMRSASEREEARAATGAQRRLKLRQVLALPLAADMATVAREAQTAPVLGAVRVLIASTSFHKAIFRWDRDDTTHVASLQLSRAANLHVHPRAAKLVARMKQVFAGARLSLRRGRLNYRYGGLRLSLHRNGSRLGVHLAGARPAQWKATFAAFARALRAIALDEALVEPAATRKALGL